MRPVKMVVGNRAVGTAKTWAYPDGASFGTYTIPTYPLTVSGTDAAGKAQRREFEVLRFGIQFKKGFAAPRVVGLSHAQTHVIKAWLPHYSVHSARSLERGAWQVVGNFLIHDGPDNPEWEIYASIGCIEICRGPRGFDRFNDYLVELSGPAARDRAARLAEIGRAKSLTISYLAAPHPALTR